MSDEQHVNASPIEADADGVMSKQLDGAGVVDAAKKALESDPTFMPTAPEGQIQSVDPIPLLPIEMNVQLDSEMVADPDGSPPEEASNNETFDDIGLGDDPADQETPPSDEEAVRTEIPFEAEETTVTPITTPNTQPPTTDNGTTSYSTTFETQTPTSGTKPPTTTTLPTMPPMTTPETQTT